MSNETEKMNTLENTQPALIPALNFATEVLHSQQPVLVAFFAPWSRPCQAFAPVLQELAAACAGRIKIVKVNADDSLDLSLWYEIQSVPTLMFFVGEKPCWRIVGTATKQAILAKLEPFLAKEV